MSGFRTDKKIHNSLVLLCTFWLALGMLLADEETRFGVHSLVTRPDKIDAWEAWTGERVGMLGEVLHAETWDDYSTLDPQRGIGWTLAQWRGRGGEKRSMAVKPSFLELSIPPFPERAGRMEPPYFEQEGRWAEGSSGVFNRHFQQLAEVLISEGWGNVHLRPASNFNMPSYASLWGIQDKPEHWASFTRYWRQIHDAMMNVEGANFTWVWTISLDGDQSGTDPLDFGWPGDSYVDVVAVSVFDHSGDYYWQRYESESPDHGWDRLRRWNWEEIEFGLVRDPYSGEVVQEEAPNLNRLFQFAKTHGKEFAVSEWGVVRGNRYPMQDRWGGNDNPMFVELMSRWIAEKDVKYALYQEELHYSPELGVIDQSILPDFWSREKGSRTLFPSFEVSNPLSSLQYLECFHGRLPKGYEETDYVPYLSLLHERFENGISSSWELDGGWRVFREALHLDNGAGLYTRTASYRCPPVEELVATFDLLIAEEGEGVSVEAGRWRVSLKLLENGRLGLIRLTDRETNQVVSTNSVSMPLLIGETYVPITIEIRRGSVFVRAVEEVVIAHETSDDEDLFRTLTITAGAGARLFLQALDVSVEIAHGDGVAVFPPQ